MFMCLYIFGYNSDARQHNLAVTSLSSDFLSLRMSSHSEKKIEVTDTHKDVVNASHFSYGSEDDSKNSDNDSESNVNFQDSEMENMSSDFNHDNLSDSGNDSDLNQSSSLQSSFLPGQKTLSLKKLAQFTIDLAKTGVLYISRVPPFMKPIKLRQLLQQYGEIGRIYLSPEESKVAQRRKKYKGNKRKNYTEGWVEFMDKKLAKHVAQTLNANKIGGKKRSYYYDDIWALKYLPKFKWSNLTEQIAYERAVKDQKMRTEMSLAKKNTREYIRNVDKAKMIESMKARDLMKMEGKEGEAVKEKTKIQRMIRQRKFVVTENRSLVNKDQALTLSRIFS